MLLLLGLDEAGYGPTLGPLVVAATSFRFEGRPPDDLWGLLRRSVASSPHPRDRRIPIADSKVIFAPQRGIRTLEEAVLAATLASGTGGEMELADRLGLGFDEDDTGYPWYGGSPIRLPLEADLLRIRPRARRLAEDLERHRVSYLGARVSILEAREFNRGVQESGSKSVVLFAAWSRLLRQCLSAAGEEAIRVVADRHGGRKAYLPLLETHLGDLRPAVVEEGPRRSDYLLAGGRVTLSFQVRADAADLPVALASMIAKYAREVRMSLFNRFWTGRVGDLRPTSGYPVDARRFLRAIHPALSRLAIPQESLVRCR